MKQLNEYGTPITDAAICCYESGTTLGMGLCAANFARDLERKLATT